MARGSRPLAGAKSPMANRKTIDIAFRISLHLQFVVGRLNHTATGLNNAANRKAGKLFLHGEPLRKWHTSKLGILTATPATPASSLTLARPWLICSRRALASVS